MSSPPATGRRRHPAIEETALPGTLTVRRVAVPTVAPCVLFDVGVEDGFIARIDPVSDADPHRTDPHRAEFLAEPRDEPRDEPHLAGLLDEPREEPLELWPGYVETHGHLALPASFDGSLDDPRLVALQYLFHGVTHVVDMFGFPLVKQRWESGRAQSPVPYPDLVHCGYAATSMLDSAGRTGHGVEFPAPVFMLGVPGDVDLILHANRAHGARFLKVMFTDGTELPDSTQRFSRLPSSALEDVARATTEHGVPAVLDCNTREEVLQAYGHGFRLFAHPVRDVELSADDWRVLRGARFVSTLSGLRPMIMQSAEFLREYARPGFAQTQDVANLDYVAQVEEPFGVRLGWQEWRTEALENMRTNSLAALERGALLVGTDCGNTGAFHGYSLLGELDLLAGAEHRMADRRRALRRALRRAVTVDGLRFFDELSGRPPTDQPIAVGAAATFNLLGATASGAALSALPQATVVNGTVVDRRAIVRDIRALRSSATRGKVIL